MYEKINDLSRKLTTAPRRHDNDNPLWLGPCREGPLGGITQSMLVRFLSCRERFRLKYILGLEPHDKWNHRLGYGHMWHACEEGLARCTNPLGKEEAWQSCLSEHTSDILGRYPFQKEEIYKWFNVCRVQFPEYVKYWAEHPDVKNRTPFLQEEVLDVPYTLPSGRVVRLRLKLDSLDLIADPDQPQGIYLQENKTKGNVDKIQIERQIKFDLQTMLYLIALITWQENRDSGPQELWNFPVLGVRYNVVRRPLSGGIGNIKPHAAKQTKNKYTPAETDEQFYERLRRDYIAKDPGYWFFRVRGEISAKDIQVFRDTCLDPLLETVCDWYGYITNQERDDGFPPDWRTRTWVGNHYRTPFGVWSALEEGGATEYDAYLETGSEAGLRRVETLFPELQ